MSHIQAETSVLEAESICVSYGDVRVLWDVSFRVEKGQIVSLVGSNGSGKTSILKTIAGILRPSSGRITFGNTVLSNLSSEGIVNAGIVYVPEGRGIFPEMSVTENLDMGSYNPRARKQRDSTIEKVFGMFPRLRERKSQAAGTLSGGEAQMLAIGRGMMALPKVLMLDEPSAGIAPIVVDKIFQTVQKLREEGITILMVEQDAGKALRLCDIGYVLETGRVKISGKGEELLSNSYVRQAYLGM